MAQAVREGGLKIRLPGSHNRRLRVWWTGFEIGNDLGGRIYQFPWSRWFLKDGRVDWLMEEVTKLRHRIRDLEYEVAPLRNPHPDDDIDQFKDGHP